ncbi:phosphatidate cytidylyltransferase [Rhodovibrio salinarum]|uniref:phosphatidate cytidylyltransferase n=1 Tax=Rhodovibrio salinarum TaxID=1087 RepID=UPI000687106B|nr:phosphatidate cytidylyltransferase [Rhodovibrio salinarum]
MSGATARRSVRADVSPLRTRVISALVMAPLVLGALYLGGVFTDLLMIAVGAGMAFEWARLTTQGAGSAVGVAALGVGVGILLYALDRPEMAALLLLLTALVAPALIGRGAGLRGRLWLAAGVVYLGAACLGFLFLRARPEVGLLLIGWLIAVVWATDIGAYAAGKSLGGPKLLVRVSPNKTWAGLVGGLASAVLVSVLVAAWQPELAHATRLPGVAGVAVAGALLALVAQAGDLLESALKRRVGAKDASGLIPGHGGLLDRADGLVAASLVLALSITALDATV